MEQQTPHQKRINEFMKLAGQNMPPKPEIPSDEVRLLRARLILEEATELINALGFSISALDDDGKTVLYDVHLGLEDDRKPNLVEIADGCADVSVVTIGTLTACGINDNPLLLAVDNNNLAKFGPGHKIREDGKLIKPPGHRPPDIKAVLDDQVLAE